MEPSQECKDFIKSKEGCKLEVYDDLNGFPTIGWGHKLTRTEQVNGQYTHDITQEAADALFESDCKPFVAQVNSLGLTLTQGQWDCCFDFCFNLGFSALKMMLAHGLDQVPKQVPLWIHAAGKVQPGLVTRRAQDLAWWNS